MDERCKDCPWYKAYFIKREWGYERQATGVCERYRVVMDSGAKCVVASHPPPVVTNKAKQAP